MNHSLGRRFLSTISWPEEKGGTRHWGAATTVRQITKPDSNQAAHLRNRVSPVRLIVVRLQVTSRQNLQRNVQYHIARRGGLENADRHLV